MIKLHYNNTYILYNRDKKAYELIYLGYYVMIL